MTQPCDECDFQANSARQLSRHKAVKHNDNPLSCVLCPFVTAYQTNLLRHRREVHGILGSKGNKSCKFCGFEADDNETLISHQEQAHQDILKSARERFAREKKSARGDCDNDNSLEEFNDQFNLNDSTIKMSQDNGNLYNLKNLLNGNKLQDQQSDEDDDKDFWKEGFIDFVDNPSNLSFNQFSQPAPSTINQNLTSNFLANFQKQFQNFNKLSPNNQIDLSNLEALKNLGNLDALNCLSSALNRKNNSTYQEIESPESEDFSENEALNTNENNTDQSRPNSRMSKSSNQEQSDNLLDGNEDDNQGEYPTTSSNADQLAPTKIRRQYSCTDCDFRTVNPREFLYHRRDIHNQKVKIVECPYCVYACQYFQKLQRHILLVHKLETSITPPTESGSSGVVKQQTNMIFQSQAQPIKKDFFVKKISTNKDDDQLLNNYSSDHELAEDNDQSQQQSIYQKSKSSSPAIRRKESLPINQMQKSSSMPRRSSTVATDDKLQMNAINGNKQLGPTGIKCKYCQFHTDTFSKLEKHENTYHLEKRFRCPFCEIKFENLVWLQRHLLHMHQNNEKAKQILETIDLISTRRKRVKTSHNSSSNNNNNNNSQNNSSAIDNQQPSAMVEFDENGMPIIEKDSTKCTICSYETKWFSELQKHMRVHTNEKPFSCQLCSFRTKWKGDLNRHINKYHAKAVSELKDQSKPSLSNGNYNGKQSNKRSLDEDDEEEDEEEDEEDDQMANNYSEYQNGQADEFEENSDEEMTMNNDNLDFQNDERDEESQDPASATDNGQQQPKAMVNNHLEILPAQNQQQRSNTSGLSWRSLNDNMVKVYKCSHCDFICSTASRFHVHFVQHLNTKPFMCSACETRSTWSWDIRKHIRMKIEKGETDHENATALLVHHSGNRDYKKYDKYLILINKNDIDNHNSNHQQDKRGLIDPQNLNANNQPQNGNNEFLNNLSSLINNLSKNQNGNQNEELEDNKSMDGDEQMDYTIGNNLDQDDNQDFNAEDIVITPDITFSIGNEMDLSINQQQQQQSLLNSASALSSLSNSLASSLNYLNNNNHLALNSNLLNNSTCSTSSSNNTNNTTNNKQSKLFYCAYCKYTHRDSKSLVSHLSQHAGKKPFKCRICGFSSNWREVLNRHVSSRHAGTSKDIEQLFRYSVCKYICRIKDENGQANPGVEITTQETIKQANAASNSLSSVVKKSSKLNKSVNSNDNSSLHNFQDFDQQNSLLMLNSILAQQLSNCDSINGLNRLNNSNSLSNEDSASLFSNIPNFANLSNLNLNKMTNDKHQFSTPSSSKPKTSTTNSNGTPKTKVETPEVLAAHGITGRVSGFKGEFKCTQCPFRAEKAFHMDFHTKRHVQMPGADFKCEYCDFWVHAKKSLVKHVYLHKYENVSPADKSSN